MYFLLVLLASITVGSFQEIEISDDIVQQTVIRMNLNHVESTKQQQQHRAIVDKFLREFITSSGVDGSKANFFFEFREHNDRWSAKSCVYYEFNETTMMMTNDSSEMFEMMLDHAYENIKNGWRDENATPTFWIDDDSPTIEVFVFERQDGGGDGGKAITEDDLRRVADRSAIYEPDLIAVFDRIDSKSAKASFASIRPTTAPRFVVGPFGTKSIEFAQHLANETSQIRISKAASMKSAPCKFVSFNRSCHFEGGDGEGENRACFSTIEHSYSINDSVANSRYCRFRGVIGREQPCPKQECEDRCQQVPCSCDKDRRRYPKELPTSSGREDFILYGRCRSIKKCDECPRELATMLSKILIGAGGGVFLITIVMAACCIRRAKRPPTQPTRRDSADERSHSEVDTAPIEPSHDADSFVSTKKHGGGGGAFSRMFKSFQKSPKRPTVAKKMTRKSGAASVLDGKKSLDAAARNVKKPIRTATIALGVSKNPSTVFKKNETKKK